MNFAQKAAVAAAAVMASTAVNAAPVYNFVANGSAPTGGLTVVDNFDTAAGLTGSNFVIDNASTATHTLPGNGSGNFLAVQGKPTTGLATYTFATPATKIQFDWGTVDLFNTIILSTASTTYTITGGDVLPGADGTVAGLFTVGSDSGESFTSIAFSSTDNAFEIDDLSASSAVPESAVWAMMLAGFGVGGASMRRRQKTALSFG